ncbi:LysE family translocator [Salaquimonas pukyongi]|uniref:LysE family translocator n=1 Tax=Salaquimonas pukyongi TaxID=2712698 RepID=UPI00096B9D2D|nr:LysE family translocator [Salaquimonas pukyongi]
MTVAAFFAYAIALGIAAAIPGPGVAALVGRALGTGFARSVPMLLGLAVGDVIYLTLAIAGLAFIATAFSAAFFVVKLAGAAYLLWLAWRFWNEGIAVRKVEKSAGRRDGIASFLAGLAVTLGNPKTIVFYMAILPAVMDLSAVTLAGYGVLVILTFLVLFVVMTPYMALASRARLFFTDPRALRRLNRSAAAAMAGTAGWIVAKG